MKIFDFIKNIFCKNKKENNIITNFNGITPGDKIIGFLDIDRIYDDEKILYIDKFINFDFSSLKEDIPPFNCEEMTYDDIYPYVEENLEFYKKEGYKIIDYTVSDDWQLP